MKIALLLTVLVQVPVNYAPSRRRGKNILDPGDPSHHQ